MASDIDEMPQRPLRLYEIQKIQEENDTVSKATGIAYANADINSAIVAVIVHTNHNYIVGFDNERNQWVEIQDLDTEFNQPEDYHPVYRIATDWAKNAYENFGVYQTFSFDFPNMPNRIIQDEEIQLLERVNESVHNADVIMYNDTGVICLFINYQNTGFVVGFDQQDRLWYTLSKVGQDEGTEAYLSESESIIDWIEERYGDNYDALSQN